MQALIDNYAREEQRGPGAAICWRTPETERVSSSTVMVLRQHVGLNNRITNLLMDYLKLQNNWDQEGSVAPNEIVIKKAINIANILEKHGQPIFHAAPGPAGEIMLDIRNNKKNRSLEVIFYPTRSVIVTFPEEGTPAQANFETYLLPTYLQWLNTN